MVSNPFLSRRFMLKSTMCGFGYTALAGLMAGESARAAATVAALSPAAPLPGPAARTAYRNPLAPKSPHFAARAKRVIFLFMQGGPSHVDTFDYKPALIRDAGKASPRGPLLPPQFKFSQHGKSGLWLSELFPNIARHADDLCLLNGMHSDNPAHPQATIALHTGNAQFVRPSMGAWVLYGLGTSNQNLPGFITINPTGRLGGAQNYGSSFLPAAYQGTRVGGEDRSEQKIDNLVNTQIAPGLQRRQLDYVQSMNRDLYDRLGENPEVEGVIESYELAFRMQSTVPQIMDISGESKATLDLYGIGDGSGSDRFATQCLLARKFAEAGVRFIEVGHGGWDQHNSLKAKLTANALDIDRAIAGLIADLKMRGLFEDTLIVWGGEFGRTPGAQAGKDGRNHNNRGYTMWMAGGGVKGGLAYGATDPHGYEAVDGKMHTHDLHATILHLMGLDHERLTYRYSGRDFRLTDVRGEVATPILA